MKLKEKFEPFAFCSLGNNSMERQYQIEDNAKECEKIADDYAVEFAEWLSKNDLYNEILLQVSETKELLEIFKKEKGL